MHISKGLDIWRQLIKYKQLTIHTSARDPTYCEVTGYRRNTYLSYR